MATISVTVKQNPGRLYAAQPIQLRATFLNESDVVTNPTTVSFLLRSPCGTETTYVYATDTEISRPSTGIYWGDITPSPNEAGRWRWRVSSTGTGTTTAAEGSFLVLKSSFNDFDDDCCSDYCLC